MLHNNTVDILLKGTWNVIYDYATFNSNMGNKCKFLYFCLSGTILIY